MTEVRTIVGNIDIGDILAEKNIQSAIRHVIRKKSKCGYDGVTARELPDWWIKNGAETRRNIINRKYMPRLALQVNILKPDGSKRKLEVPSVIDRMLQYAACYIMQPYYENVFHENSHGFRLSRGTGTAIENCLRLMNDGNMYVADLDIKSYFDNVDHVLLLEFLEKDIGDRALYDLIEAYIKIKVSNGNHIYRKCKGVSQGGPLSPLLANIMLNGFDWYLEDMGYNFVRYADDVVILCSDYYEAENALNDARGYLKAMLHLELNLAKTSVCRADEITFLGYRFLLKSDGRVEAGISEKAFCRIQERMDEHIRAVCEDKKIWWERIGAHNRGWLNYYEHAIGEDMKYVVGIMDERERDAINFRVRTDGYGEIYENALWESKGYVTPMAWYREMERAKEYAKKKQGKYPEKTQGNEL